MSTCKQVVTRLRVRMEDYSGGEVGWWDLPVFVLARCGHWESWIESVSMYWKLKGRSGMG